MKSTSTWWVSSRIKEEVVLYSALVAEIWGVVLDQDERIPSIEDEIEPQGRAKELRRHGTQTLSHSASQEWMHRQMIIHANNDEINKIDDHNNYIMSIATFPPANNPNSLVLSDTSDKNDADTNNDKPSNNDEPSNHKSSNDNNPGTQEEIVVDKPAEDPTESEDQGVHQSKRTRTKEGQASTGSMAS